MEKREVNISLIITTYNRKDALELVLLSTMTQSVMPFEVIVADDGSTKDTEELIKHYQAQFPVKLLHCWQEDKGFRVSHIRNKAFAMASGTYIIMVDGDVILHRNFIGSHLEHIKANQFIQGSRVLLSPEATKKAIELKQIRFTPFSKGIKNRFNAISNRLLSQLIQVLYKGDKTHKGVRSCNLSCWKSDLIKVNGFSEEFIGWGREDSEFVVRLLNNCIKRTNLKFGGVVYHLWHKENKTDDLLKKNDILLENAITEGRKVCEIGINQYL